MGRGNEYKAQVNNRAAYSLQFLWEPKQGHCATLPTVKRQHWTSLHRQGQAEDLAHTCMSCLYHIYNFLHSLEMFPGSLALFKRDI